MRTLETWEECQTIHPMRHRYHVLMYVLKTSITSIKARPTAAPPINRFSLATSCHSGQRGHARALGWWALPVPQPSLAVRPLATAPPPWAHTHLPAGLSRPTTTPLHAQAGGALHPIPVPPGSAGQP